MSTRSRKGVLYFYVSICTVILYNFFMLRQIRIFHSESLFNTFLFIVSFVPFFVIPFGIFFKDQSRFILLSIYCLLLSIILLVKSFNNHSKNIRLSKLEILLLVFPVWYFVSFLFSVDRYRSFLGIGVSTDTLFFIIIMSLLCIITSFFNRKRNKIEATSSVFIFSVFLFVLLVVGSLFLQFSFDTNYLGFFTSSNFISSFNDLSILTGAVLLILIVFSNYKFAFDRYSFYLFLLSIFLSTLLFFVNFSINIFGILLPINLIIIAFIIVYQKKVGRLGFGKNLNRLAIFVLAIVLSFSFFRSDINTYFSRIFNIESSEINLTWGSNFKLIEQSIIENPFTGFGPNTSSIAWEKIKPSSFNLTDFWQTRVRGSSSYLFNIFVTTGLIGFLIFASILFFSLRLSSGLIKRQRQGEDFFAFLKDALALLNIYLIFVLIFYNPGFLIVYVFFVSLGILISIEKSDNTTKEYNLDSKDTYYSKAIKILLLAIFVFLVLFILKISIASLSISLTDNIRDNDIDTKIKLSKLAIVFDQRPEYLSVLSRFQLIKAKSVYFSDDKLSDSLNQEFNFYVQESVANIEKAYFLNQRDYDICLDFGDVLFDIGIMGGKDAFGLALDKYLEATSINPNNPVGLFLSAKTAFHLGRYDLVDQLLKEAIRLKINYSEAYFLLAMEKEVSGDILGAKNLYDIARKISENKDFYLINYVAFLYRNNYKDDYNHFIEEINKTENASFIRQEVDSIKDDKLEELKAYLII